MTSVGPRDSFGRSRRRRRTQIALEALEGRRLLAKVNNVILSSPVVTETQITITPIYLPPPSTVPNWLGGRNTRVAVEVKPSADPPIPSGTVTAFLNGKALGTYHLSQGVATVVFAGRQVFNKPLVFRFNQEVVGSTAYAASSSAPFVATRAFFHNNSPMNHPAGV